MYRKASELFFFALKDKPDTNDIESGGYVHGMEMCYSRRGCVKKSSAKSAGCCVVCGAYKGVKQHKLQTQERFGE